MSYRKEIDGLRALAVLPVMFFHAGLPVFPGGFVGVDVFFVISGYLITSLILDEQARGQFSLAGFYERRMRRILPALSIVLVSASVAAWFILLPHELETFGESVIAVVLFVSNILFWWQTDYFAPTAEQIPLLHTWSLAVEEQFYLLFPLLLMSMRAWSVRVLASVLLLLGALSLGWAEWLWRQSFEANFYLLPSRVWELMLGALCAMFIRTYGMLTGVVAQLGAVLGLAALGYALLAFDDSLPFPGLYALVPTLGTALLILGASSATWVGNVLGLKPLVAIGVISYSAYLWHQPVFVFARLQLLEEPTPLIMLGLMVASLALAVLSWYGVEKPCRDRRRFSRQQVFIGSLISGVVGLLAGGGLALWGAKASLIE